MAIDPNTGASNDGARPDPFALARHAFSAWIGRARDLRALAALDERTLKDLGLNRYDISAGAAAAPAVVSTPPVVRRLGRRDLPEVERHLLALGPADRRKRFLSPADDGAIARYVAGIDPGRAVVVGAMDPDGGLAGIAEAHPVVDAPRTVEVAVSVHPYHRREGLGRHLVARAVALASAEGAEAAVFLFAPENRAVAGLAAALGARFTELGGALLVEATLVGRGEDEAARGGLALAA